MSMQYVESIEGTYRGTCRCRADTVVADGVACSLPAGVGSVSRTTSNGSSLTDQHVLYTVSFGQYLHVRHCCLLCVRR